MGEVSPTCFNCSHVCDEDHFCHGCKSYVCDDCDVSCGEYGRGHSREDHLVAPEEREPT